VCLASCQLGHLHRIWIRIQHGAASMVKAMFNVLVTVHVRDGTKALFWSDRWMDSSLVGSLAPLVVAAVQPRVRKTRLVADGLQNMRWIQDIYGSLFVSALTQYVTLSKM
jgi:hypothetical protein